LEHGATTPKSLCFGVLKGGKRSRGISKATLRGPSPTQIQNQENNQGSIERAGKSQNGNPKPKGRNKAELTSCAAIEKKEV